KAKADSVLVGHVVVNSLDGNRPSSVSKPVHEVLRKELINSFLKTSCTGLDTEDGLFPSKLLTTTCTTSTESAIAYIPAINARKSFFLISSALLSSLAKPMCVFPDDPYPGKCINVTVTICF